MGEHDARSQQSRTKRNTGINGARPNPTASRSHHRNGALIRHLLEDQYSRPVRVVAFNTAEGWSRDVTVDIADELRRRFPEYDEVPRSVQEFLETAVRR
jgi:hypothetical protein